MRENPFRLQKVMVHLMLIFSFLLSACGPRFTPTGQLEKSVDGHDVILKWETGDNDQTNCLTDVSLKGGESLFRSLIPFEACTAENVASSLEGTKKMLSASAPSWQTEVLDQFIAELRR